jgi:PHD/YefM family antitoxin component YafN of YafNO toxin-antitoxin module
MPRSATQKRPETLSHSLTRVVAKRERVVVHRRGKAVAALIPLEDLALLEELDDRLEVEEALKVLNDPADMIIPWDQAKTELDRA